MRSSPGKNNSSLKRSFRSISSGPFKKRFKKEENKVMKRSSTLKRQKSATRAPRSLGTRTRSVKNKAALQNHALHEDVDSIWSWSSDDHVYGPINEKSSDEEIEMEEDSDQEQSEGSDGSMGNEEKDDNNSDENENSVEEVNGKNQNQESKSNDENENQNQTNLHSAEENESKT